MGDGHLHLVARRQDQAIIIVERDRQEHAGAGTRPRRQTVGRHCHA